MAENRGKQFEKVIKNAFNKVPNTVVYRLQDSMGGFSGVANISDFIIYHYPKIYFIECKTCHGNTWNFKNLTDKQRTGLSGVSKIDGVHAGILLWFVDKDVTMWIDISDIEHRIEKGYKSIRFTDGYRKIKGRKKRVFFDYDLEDFIKDGGEYECL